MNATEIAPNTLSNLRASLRSRTPAKCSVRGSEPAVSSCWGVAPLFTAILALGIISVLGGMPTTANADVYRWVEPDGTVNYGEREPRGREFTVISRSAPPPKNGRSAQNQSNNQSQPAPAPTPGIAQPGTLPADDNLSDRQRAMLERLKEDEARRQEGIAEIRKSNCATSKRVLTQMQDTRRIRIRNDAGEEVAMTDEERSERIRQAQQSIAVNCDSIG